MTDTTAIDNVIPRADIVKRAARIGAEIRNIKLSGDLSDQVIGAINKVLIEHKVIFFRDQGHLDDAEEVRARFERVIAERKRNEDASPIKYWKSTGVASKGGLISDPEIQIWIDWLVKDGLLKPDQLRASDPYTNEFNFYRAGKQADAE